MFYHSDQATPKSKGIFMSLKNYVKRSLFLLICLSTNLYAAKPTIAVLDFDIKRNNVGFSKDFVLVTPIEDTTRILSSELIRYIVSGADHISKGAIVRIKTEHEEIAPVRELTPGSSDKPVKW